MLRAAFLALSLIGLSGCALLREPLPTSVPDMARQDIPQISRFAPRDIAALPHEDNYVPLEVFLDHIPAGVVDGYMDDYGQSAYVPICPTLELLQLPCEWDPALQTLSLAAQDKAITLARDEEGQWRLYRGTDSVTLGPGDIYSPESDPIPYTHPDLLSLLTPAHWRYDPQSLSIKGRAYGPIAFLNRHAFDQRRGQGPQRAIPAAQPDQAMPAITAPMTPGLPLFDTLIATQFRNEAIHTSASVQTSMDLGLASGQFSLIANQNQGIRGGRLTLERDIAGTHIYAGDVTFGDFRFLGSLRGVGVSVSSGPQDEGFLTFPLQGEGPVGWDVEVRARDMPFIGFTKIGEDGRWHLDDVPVQSGGTVFDVLLISPSGETRQDVLSIVSAPGTPMPGQWRWRATFVNEGDRVFGASDDRSDLWIGAASFEYGLRPGLGLRGGIGQERAAQDHSRTLTYLGLSHRYGRLQGRIDAASDGQHMALALDESIAFPKTRIALSSVYTQDEFRGREDTLAARLRLTHSFKHAAVGLGASYQRQGSFADQITGNISVTTRYKGWLIGANTFAPLTSQTRTPRQWGLSLTGQVFKRYRARWVLAGQDRLNEVNLNVDWPGPGEWQFGTQLRHDLSRDETQLRLATSRNIWDLRLRAELGLGQDEVFGGLVLATSFTPVDQGLSYHRTDTPLGGRAIGAILACIDENMNARCDRDDPPLEGIKLARSRYTTDEKGQAFIPLAPWRDTQIEVDLASVSDPFLTPYPPRQTINLRPGRAMRLDIPLRRTGDMTGWIRDEAGLPIARAQITIRDVEGGEFDHSVRAGRDGFFFMSLPYGQYRLTLEAEGQTLSTLFSVDDDEPQPTLELTLPSGPSPSPGEILTAASS